MPEFSYVKRGDKIEIPAAVFHNAIVDAIRFTQSFRTGFYDDLGYVDKVQSQARRVIQVTMTDEIPIYSIFTFDTNDPETWDLELPTCKSAKISSSDEVFIVNHNIECESGARYVLPILGVHKPYLVAYDGDAPALGDIVGPVPGSYKVSTGYTGCICVSSPDELNTAIWVVRSCVASELVELCAKDTATRSVPYDALLGTWDPDINGWCYNGAPTVKAIDHRYGMPLAEEGWKGKYEKKPSTAYGTIYECVSLDCDRPPEGCTCESGTGSGS